tara:strand:- start:290 stop:1084 length:795 start_codon:yes stop_codon:yes gene_type:complete
MNKKRACVIGTNVSKSLSPLIFNYWFKKYNIDAEYFYKEIEEKNFKKEIKKLFKEEDLCGFNVTIPFKEKIIQYLDSIDKHSKIIGAVNCVSKSEKIVEGTNTDWTGFGECIKHIKKKEGAVVIGYGGSSKAVIYSLLSMGFKKVRVFNRSYEKIKNLKDIIPHKLQELEDYFYKEDIIINTIPKSFDYDFGDINLKNLPSPKESVYGFDLVYNYPTSFLKYITKSKRIFGIEMLAQQAAPCFYKWFGIIPEIDINLIKKLKEQ